MDLQLCSLGEDARLFSHGESLKPPPLEAQSINVSFKMLLVEIDRSWLDLSVFGLNGVRVHGYKKGGYSTGLNEQNDGIFPLVSRTLVVVRDVDIYLEGLSESNPIVVEQYRQRQTRLLSWTILLSCERSF